MPYRVIQMTTHHQVGLTEVETAMEAIELGDKIISAKFPGVVFIARAGGSERMPLKAFKEKHQNHGS
jgi:hypothetical protein